MLCHIMNGFWESLIFLGLPRPSPSPKSSISSKGKLTPARSLESVPITVNSHIPASPLRPSSVVAFKKVTSEMGTQVEQEKQVNQVNNNNQVTKSVSVENLSSPTTSSSQSKKNKSKSSSSGCLLLAESASKKTGHSESSDPICASSGTQKVKKWSYTNGRTS